MLKIRTILFAIVFIFVASFVEPTNAQTWNSNAGGYNTGYGTVYGSFGLAMATQNMYNTMQMNIQRATMRQAMINKWGKAAVEKAEANARAGRTSSAGNSAAASGPVISTPPPVRKYYGAFKPDASIVPGKNIADALGDTPEEKALLKQIVQATKSGFEAEASAQALKNNIAGSLTFFIVATSTIYNESDDPSDEAVQTLFNAIDQTIDEIPEFGKMSNAQKQDLYNTFIGMAAIPLATYTEGKQTADASTVQTARQLAGELIKMVLKVDPSKVKFSNGAWEFGK